MSHSRVRKLAAALALVLISGAALAGTATTTFPVSATAVAACTVSATTLNFGTFATLTSPVDATNTLTVNCALGVPYSVALSVGTGAGASPASRKLTATQGSTLNYSIFQSLNDALLQSPWADGIGGTTLLIGNGTGVDQIFNPFGRIFSGQTIPFISQYTDTITVTVEF